MSKFFFGTPSSGMSCNEIRLGDEKLLVKPALIRILRRFPKILRAIGAVALLARVCQRFFFIFFPKRFKIHRRASFEMMTRH